MNRMSLASGSYKFMINVANNNANHQNHSLIQQATNSDFVAPKTTGFSSSPNYEFSTKIIKPNDYFFFSIFTSLFCCMPIGKWNHSISISNINDSFIFVCLPKVCLRCTSPSSRPDRITSTLLADQFDFPSFH